MFQPSIVNVDHLGAKFIDIDITRHPIGRNQERRCFNNLILAIWTFSSDVLGQTVVFFGLFLVHHISHTVMSKPVSDGEQGTQSISDEPDVINSSQPTNPSRRCEVKLMNVKNKTGELCQSFDGLLSMPRLLAI